MLSRAEGALYSSGPVRQPSAVFLICIVDTFSFQNSPLYMNLKPFFRNMLVWVILRKWIYVRTYILNTDIFLLQKIDVFLLNLNFFFFHSLEMKLIHSCMRKCYLKKKHLFERLGVCLFTCILLRFLSHLFESLELRLTQMMGVLLKSKCYHDNASSRQRDGLRSNIALL